MKKRIVIAGIVGAVAVAITAVICRKSKVCGQIPVDEDDDYDDFEDEEVEKEDYGDLVSNGEEEDD